MLESFANAETPSKGATTSSPSSSSSFSTSSTSSLLKVKSISEPFEVMHNMSEPYAGGLIAAREFLFLRHVLPLSAQQRCHIEDLLTSNASNSSNSSNSSSAPNADDKDKAIADQLHRIVSELTLPIVVTESNEVGSDKGKDPKPAVETDTRNIEKNEKTSLFIACTPVEHPGFPPSTQSVRYFYRL